MEKTKKEVIRRVIGIIIFSASLPNIVMGAGTFIMVSVIGWTTDGTHQPFSEQLYIRLLGALNFFSSIALSFAGIQIIRNKLKVLTYVALLFGLVSAIYLYGSWFSWHMSPYSSLSRGDSGNTIKYYSSIIQKEGAEGAYRKRGEIYYGIAEYENALADFKAIKDYQFIILAYIKLNDFENSLAVCDEWIRVRPDPSLSTLKGNLYYRHGDYDLAMQEYLKTAQNTGDYIRLANCSAKLGNISLAEQNIDQAYSRALEYEKKYGNDCDIIDALVAKGNLYWYRKDLPKAKAEYSNALQKHRSWAVEQIPEEILKTDFGVSDDELQKKVRDTKDPSRKIYDDLTWLFGIPSL